MSSAGTSRRGGSSPETRSASTQRTSRSTASSTGAFRLSARFRVSAGLVLIDRTLLSSLSCSHVQVFAPSPPGLHAPHAHAPKLRTPRPLGAPPPDDSDSDDDDEAPLNGFDLLNEVSSGGTLSSLFTILSLFTEDVRLEWDPPAAEESEAEAYRAGIERDDESAEDQRGGFQSFRDTVNSPTHPSGLPLASDDGLSTPVLGSGSPYLASSGDRMSSARSSSSRPSSSTRTPLESPRMGMGSRAASSRQSTRGGTPLGEPRNIGQGARFAGGEGHDAERGTVARATVDSTLAVIPADAFRRLTKKFPKASAHIVQGPLQCSRAAVPRRPPC
jgi:hypothetical protein